MSGTYEFVQLDVFTKALLTSNPLAIFHRRTRMTSLRRDYGRRCEFSVRLFELIVDQTHRPQECVPARVAVEIGQERIFAQTWQTAVAASSNLFSSRYDKPRPACAQGVAGFNSTTRGNSARASANRFVAARLNARNVLACALTGSNSTALR